MKVVQQFMSDIFGSADTPQASSTAVASVELSAAAKQHIAEHGLLLAYASETGFIEDVAETLEEELQAAGVPTVLLEMDDVDTTVLQKRTTILFMTSTTGSGDAPFSADSFWQDVMAESIDLAHLHFGLLTAGDSDYDTFCGFGHELRDWLVANGAQPLFQPIDVDGEDEDAIDLWRRQVKNIFAATGAAAESDP